MAWRSEAATKKEEENRRCTRMDANEEELTTDSRTPRIGERGARQLKRIKKD